MGQISPYIGTVALVLFLLIMINKFRWKITQLLTGMIVMGILSGFFPALPGVISSAWKAVLHALHLQ